VSVLAPLRVLLVSTGDELQEPGSPLEPGRIYGANGASLTVALAECGVDLVGVEVVTDDAAALLRLLAARGAEADLVITTGGVSKGDYEVVRDALEPAGADFVSVAMQPGGPQGLGIAELGSLRNPVSALVSFEMFVRPVIRALHGLPSRRPTSHAPLAEPVESSPVKHRVRRGVVDASGVVHLIGGAGSHLLHGYASSTVLVHLPAGVGHLAGDEVEIWRIDD
jgi:molybdopterin molybdotransferase